MRPKLFSLVATVAVALLGGTSPLTGQRRIEPILPVTQASSLAVNLPVVLLTDALQSRPANDVTLVLAGVAGAAVGTLGGAFLGYQFDRNYSNWGCERGARIPASGAWLADGSWDPLSRPP